MTLPLCKALAKLGSRPASCPPRALSRCQCGPGARCSSTAGSYMARATTPRRTRYGSAWTCGTSRPGNPAGGPCSRVSWPAARRARPRSYMTRLNGAKCGTTLATGSLNVRHRGSTAGTSGRQPAPSTAAALAVALVPATISRAAPGVPGALAVPGVPGALAALAALARSGCGTIFWGATNV